MSSTAVVRATAGQHPLPYNTTYGETLSVQAMRDTMEHALVSSLPAVTTSTFSFSLEMTMRVCVIVCAGRDNESVGVAVSPAAREAAMTICGGYTEKARLHEQKPQRREDRSRCFISNAEHRKLIGFLKRDLVHTSTNEVEHRASPRQPALSSLSLSSSSIRDSRFALC